MSETDDTDDLLLIPPDFFVNNLDLVENYTAAPYFGIVDTLISHVHTLNDRVKIIEHSDVLSLNSSAISDRNIMEERKYNSSDDLLRQELYPSTYSTPQKPREKYRLNSLPSTPSTDSPPKQYKPRPQFTMKKDRKKMMREIDGFIENTTDEAIGRTINLKDIETMIDHLETNKRETESRLREKEKAILKTKLTSSDTLNITDCAFGDKSGSCSSDSTQMTARRLHLSPENMLHRNTRSAYNLNDELLENGKMEGTNINSVKLLSLQELWGKKGDEALKEKLQEEKLRRTHCEQLIQELQSKSLELQERLAVALEVDHSKDNAIKKFYNAWEQVSIRLQTLTKERDSLENDLKDLQCRSIADLAETAKKVAHYENEASKALNLAHSNQDKLVKYEQANKTLLKQMQDLEKKMNEVEKKYRGEVDKNRQLNEIVVQKEIELNEGKNVLSESRKEIAQSKKAVELCQAELVNMKTQYKQLELLLNDKHDIIKDLEIQKRNILADNDNLKDLNQNLEDEVQKTKEQIDKNKQDLRNFYQQQVEVVVKDKLKEFQGELDKAESSWQEEIKTRELTIAKSAAVHIQQLSEKHNLEVNLLEKKHKEEVNLYQMQMSQSHQQIEHLQMKMKQLNERRATVAQQLQKVMEAQWLEALKIINNTKSPMQDQTLSQLHSLKSKSYSNLEEVLAMKIDGDDKKPSLPSSSSLNDSYGIQETPVNSKLYRGRQQVENELQKYVQLLLNKPTVNILDVEALDYKSGKPESFDSDKISWPTNTGNENSKLKSLHQPPKICKPPWK